MSSPAPAEPARPPWQAIVIGAALVAVVVVGFLLLRGGGEKTEAITTPATGATESARPVAVTSKKLAKLAQGLQSPLFWVGPQRGDTYELTGTTDGQFYVRYLPAGVEPGDPRPDFLTVGTYPKERALATVQQAAARPGAQTAKLADGGLAVANQERPNSWYVAYPDGGQLVEVFSPKAGRARALIRRGRLVPITR